MMTMLSAFVALELPLVALTVKLKVPAAVGVPEMVPADKPSPAGRAPLEIDHVTDTAVASNVALYCTPTIPFGRSSVVISNALEFTYNVAGLESTEPAELLTRQRNWKPF